MESNEEEIGFVIRHDKDGKVHFVLAVGDNVHSESLCGRMDLMVNEPRDDDPCCIDCISSMREFIDQPMGEMIDDTDD